MTKIEKAILQTLAFFDILSRPLTLEEIWHYLYCQPASKLEVLLGLQKLAKKRKISKIDNYYFLKGREEIVKSFKIKKELCCQRFQKVAWVVKILKLAPFVKNISIINSLSFGTSTEKSDIDIMLVSKKRRLWTARAFVIFFLEILGQNKNKWYQANKFCLGFAFSEERLNLAPIRLKSPAGSDIYFTYWLAHLTPVYDTKTYQKLIELNPWIHPELPNWQEKKKNYEVRSTKIGFLEKILSGKLGEKLENWLAKIQIKRVWQDPIHHRKGASVVADFSMLKLHPYDKRKEYQKNWEKIIKRLAS